MPETNFFNINPETLQEDEISKWTATFNEFPLEMLETLMTADPDAWQEVTTPQVNDDNLPMFGHIWSFKDGPDKDWLENEDNSIQIMSQLGFRIYKHDEWNYFFGIDAAGYNFYNKHWKPLYNIIRGFYNHVNFMSL